MLGRDVVALERGCRAQSCRHEGDGRAEERQTEIQSVGINAVAASFGQLSRKALKNYSEDLCDSIPNSSYTAIYIRTLIHQLPFQISNYHSLKQPSAPLAIGLLQAGSDMYCVAASLTRLSLICTPSPVPGRWWCHALKPGEEKIAHHSVPG